MRAPLLWTRSEIEDWLNSVRARYGRPMLRSEIDSWEHHALCEALSYQGQNDCIDDAAIVATMLLIREVVRESFVLRESAVAENNHHDLSS